MDVRKTILFIIGLLILGFGIRFTIIAADSIGVGAWDAINLRLNTLFPSISIGTWLIIVAIVIVVISGILLKEIPKFHYLLTSVFVGVSVDISGFIIPNIHPIVALGVGMLLITWGSLLYLEANLLRSPIDYYMHALMYRLNISIGKAKFLTELSALCIALILRANIFIGAFIIMFTLGFLFNIFHQPIHNFTNRFKKVTSKN